LNFSLYIAKRYLFTKSRRNAINIMTLIASGGVIVAAAALFIVLSVFAGLKTYSLQFTSFVDPDIKLFPKTGKSFIATQDLTNKINAIEGVAQFSKVIEERVIIRSENKNLLATLKAVDSNYLEVTEIDAMIAKGNWHNGEKDYVVCGWGISNTLSFGIFDFLKPLSLYVPKPGKGQLSSIKGAYNSVYVNNVGLFDINEQLNNSVIYADISLAQELLNYQTQQISSIEIKLSEYADESEVLSSLKTYFGDNLIIKTRVQLNDALYKMLNTENLAIYLIFTLVIIIALFNVVGAMIMMILDKKPSLLTLYNLGVEIKGIKQIFFLQGSLMTLISGILGVLVGLIIVSLQQQFNLIMLTPELPYPVQLKAINILIVLVTIFVLGFLASKVASQRINESLIRY